MEKFIARQPNGLLCEFSMSAACITECNMTEKEYIELCAERARKEAKYVLENCVYSFDLVKRYTQFRYITRKKWAKMLKEMGDSREI